MSHANDASLGAPPAGGLAAAVARGQADPVFLAALRGILAAAEEAAADAGASCRACGNCCRFEEFGHRLYLTTGELALLTLRPAGHAPGPGRCPYQEAQACTARDRRALGCRIFFCQGPAGADLEALYEAFHAEIGRLHARLGVEYQYVELTAGLACGAVTPSPRQGRRRG